MSMVASFESLLELVGLTVIGLLGQTWEVGVLSSGGAKLSKVRSRVVLCLCFV